MIYEQACCYKGEEWYAQDRICLGPEEALTQLWNTNKLDAGRKNPEEFPAEDELMTHSDPSLQNTGSGFPQPIMCTPNSCESGDYNCDGIADAICYAKPEVCNNIDDDKDGVIDDGVCSKECKSCGGRLGGFSCSQSECEILGGCRFTGNWIWGSCVPLNPVAYKIDEVCGNNVDDNHNNRTDEGCDKELNKQYLDYLKKANISSEDIGLGEGYPDCDSDKDCKRGLHCSFTQGGNEDDLNYIWIKNFNGMDYCCGAGKEWDGLKCSPDKMPVFNQEAACVSCAGGIMGCSEKKCVGLGNCCYQSGVCHSLPCEPEDSNLPESCFDSMLNGDEAFVDCGGKCKPCDKGIYIFLEDSVSNIPNKPIEGTCSLEGIIKMPGDTLTLAVYSLDAGKITVDYSDLLSPIGFKSKTLSVKKGLNKFRFQISIKAEGLQSVGVEGTYLFFNVVKNPSAIFITDRELLFKEYKSKEQNLNSDAYKVLASVFKRAYTDNGAVYYLDEQEDIPKNPRHNPSASAKEINGYASQVSDFIRKKCTGSCDSIIIIGSSSVVPGKIKSFNEMRKSGDEWIKAHSSFETDQQFIPTASTYASVIADTASILSANVIPALVIPDYMSKNDPDIKELQKLIYETFSYEECACYGEYMEPVYAADGNAVKLKAVKAQSKSAHCGILLSVITQKEKEKCVSDLEKKYGFDEFFYYEPTGQLVDVSSYSERCRQRIAQINASNINDRIKCTNPLVGENYFAAGNKRLTSPDSVDVIESRKTGCGSYSSGFFDDNIVPILLGDVKTNSAIKCITHSDSISPLGNPVFSLQRNPWTNEGEAIILYSDKESSGRMLALFYILMKSYDQWRPVPGKIGFFTAIDIAKLGLSFVPVAENLVDLSDIWESCQDHQAWTPDGYSQGIASEAEYGYCALSVISLVLFFIPYLNARLIKSADKAANILDGMKQVEGAAKHSDNVNAILHSFSRTVSKYGKTGGNTGSIDHLALEFSDENFLKAIYRRISNMGGSSKPAAEMNRVMEGQFRLADALQKGKEVPTLKYFQNLESLAHLNKQERLAKGAEAYAEFLSNIGKGLEAAQKGNNLDLVDDFVEFAGKRFDDLDAGKIEKFFELRPLMKQLGISVEASSKVSLEVAEKVVKRSPDAARAVFKMLEGIPHRANDEMVEGISRILIMHSDEISSSVLSKIRLASIMDDARRESGPILEMISEKRFFESMASSVGDGGLEVLRGVEIQVWDSAKGKWKIFSSSHEMDLVGVKRGADGKLTIQGFGETKLNPKELSSAADQVNKDISRISELLNSPKVPYRIAKAGQASGGAADEGLGLIKGALDDSSLRKNSRTITSKGGVAGKFNHIDMQFTADELAEATGQLKKADDAGLLKNIPSYKSGKLGYVDDALEPSSKKSDYLDDFDDVLEEEEEEILDLMTSKQIDAAVKKFGDLAQAQKTTLKTTLKYLDSETGESVIKNIQTYGGSKGIKPYLDLFEKADEDGRKALAIILEDIYGDAEKIESKLSKYSSSSFIQNSQLAPVGAADGDIVLRGASFDREMVKNNYPHISSSAIEGAKDDFAQFIFDHGMKKQGTSTDIIEHLDISTRNTIYHSATLDVDTAEWAAGRSGDGFIFVIKPKGKLIDVKDVISKNQKLAGYAHEFELTIVGDIIQDEFVGAIHMKGGKIMGYMPNPNFGGW